MSLDAYKDSSMLELFRLEAQAQTQVMDSCLLVLEREPTDPAQLEACMRAAHSLKGAARIVGLDVAVTLAHVMEDLLVCAQSGKVRLSSTRIDALLRASEALRQLSEGISVQGLPALQAILADDTQQDAPAPDAMPDFRPALPEEVSAIETNEPEPAGELHDRILRVSAERLDCMGCAMRCWGRSYRLVPRPCYPM